MVDINDPDEYQWWPERERWPKAEGDFLLYYEHALALLLLEEAIVPLVAFSSGQDEESATAGLFVCANDAFHYATADAERIPPVGFGNDLDRPFWDLYELYRAKGYYGSIEWIALRRNKKPLPRIIEKMKKDGVWTEELEALPS